MHRLLAGASALALVGAFDGTALAQSGALSKAVGGYSFEDAVKDDPATKDYNSADGRLTFAIITHTAGNGFFDPTYVGAKMAADLVGVNLLMLGSEAPVDDIPAPARDHQPGGPGPDHRRLHPDHAAGWRLQRHRQGPARQGHPGRHHQQLRWHALQPLRHQPHRPGRDRRGDRRRGAGAMRAGEGRQSGSILFPSTTTLGNVEVNNRITAAFTAAVATLAVAGKLGNFKVDAGPENIGIDVDANNPVGSIVSLIESRGDVVGVMGGQRLRHPGDRRRRGPAQHGRQDLLLRLRSRPQAAGAAQEPARWTAPSASSRSCRASGR